MTTDIKELATLIRLNADMRLWPAADAIEAMAGEVERLKTEAKTATTLLEAEKWSRAHVKSIIVSDLEAECDRLKGEAERWEKNHEALQDKFDSMRTCACQYDSSDAVCMAHSPALKAAEAERDRLRAALLIAQEAMQERRAYCHEWEYKYRQSWDDEDEMVRNVLGNNTNER